MIADMTFTSDWTTPHAPNWTQWLGHLAGTPCLGLEIGVYEGRSTAWFLENICTHPGSHLFAVDPWASKSEANRYAIKMSAHGVRFDFFGMDAERLLATWRQYPTARYDFIYLDGAKEASQVLEHTVLAWPLLKHGGILIWDDYQWEWKEGNGGRKPILPPGPGIDAFLAAYSPQLQVAGQGWQMAVRKI